MSAEEQFRVLVVDDEDRVRLACRRVLEAEGLRVFEAGDGQKGLDLLDQVNPDLVLVDLMMPNLGGMDLMAAARERHPDLAFVVITGYATLEKAVEAMKQGADDFLAKPFKPGDLRQVVSRVLRRARTLLDMEIEKSRTRLVLDSTSNGVLVLDAGGKVALMNPALRRMVGWGQSASPRGLDVDKVLPCPEVVAVLHRILEPGGDIADRVPCRIKLGTMDEPLHVQAYCRPFKDSRGNLIGAVAICNDVTAWHHLDELKNEYVSTVAHDIASPLGSVISQLQTLQKGLCGDLTDKQDQMVSRAILRVQGIVDMSKDLLSLTRLDEGADVELEEVDLLPILRESYEVFLGKAQKKQQTLELETPDALPPMQGIGRALRQVVDNLVSNALRYTPEGGRVKLSASAPAGSLVIKVEDTGYGIPEEDQERIFQRFYRVKDANTRHIVGTGLGLPIVKKVVEDHGGGLELDSRPGAGSTFTVTLPLQPGA